jgi:hypothetical protein
MEWTSVRTRAVPRKEEPDFSPVGSNERDGKVGVLAGKGESGLETRDVEAAVKQLWAAEQRREKRDECHQGRDQRRANRPPRSCVSECECCIEVVVHNVSFLPHRPGKGTSRPSEAGDDQVTGVAGL